MGEWTLYEIYSYNSLNEKKMIYADYVKNESFRTEDLSNHTIKVIDTHPTTLDVSSITVSENLAINSYLDLSFKLHNINYMKSRSVRVGYLGPQEENSLYPNIEYFDLYTRDTGLTWHSNIVTPFSEKYEKGEWKLISISYQLSNEYGEFLHHQTIYDTNYNNLFGKTSSNYGTADLSAGNFILQERVSNTSLIDVNSLKVDKEVYTAGETVKITVNPLPDAEILNSLNITFIVPSTNELFMLGGSYNNQSKKYELLYNSTKSTNSGDWLVDHIVQGDHNGKLTYLYNSNLYGDGHYNLSNGYFKIIENKDPSILYTTHVQSYGWQAPVKDGIMSGTAGESKRLEGIKINLENMPFTGGLQYRTHVQEYGWTNWVTEGVMSGTEGQSKRLEAIQIKLTGEISTHYDIYYRVHAQNYGWLDWAKNGEEAGTSGLAKRLEAIEIILIPKDSPAPGPVHKPFIVLAPRVSYSTHIQSIGWQNFMKDGQMSGTTGQAKRLEAIKIKVENSPYSGGVEYRTHVQSYGWQNWTNNGQRSGTSGESKRLESIQVKLTGELANHFDIYYRVHSETYGWLDWAKNGAKAGTEGKSKRLEGIKILLVSKDEPAPGPTNRPFIF